MIRTAATVTRDKGSIHGESPCSLACSLTTPTSCPASVSFLQVGSPATLAAGTAHFAALALMGGGLVAWSAAGRRVTPPVVMDSPVAFLAAAAPWRLMAVTCTARLQVWDLERRKCILNESVMPVINAAATADASGARRAGT